MHLRFVVFLGSPCCYELRNDQNAAAAVHIFYIYILYQNIIYYILYTTYYRAFS
jgi:hypothetical protein